MKNDRKGATLYLKIPADLYDKVVAAADRGHRPISAQVEVILERYFKARERK